MTILRKQGGGGGSSIIINMFTVATTATLEVPSGSTDTSAYGSIIVDDGTDSLIFDYTILNLDNLRTGVYAMFGKQFNIDIGDYDISGVYGLTITNNEAGTLNIKQIIRP